MGESVRLDDRLVWEIRVKWNDTVMDVLELRPSAGEAFGFSIGEDPACDYPVGASWISGESRFDLLYLDDLGRVGLRLPSGGRGWLIPRSGARQTFGGMILAGQTAQCPAFLDAHLISLEGALEASLEVGPWAFELRRGVAEEQVAGSFRVDRRSFIFPGASLLAHGIFFLLIYLIPPQSKAFQMDPLDAQNRYVRAMVLVPPKIVEPVHLPGRQTAEASGAEESANGGKPGSARPSPRRPGQGRRPSRAEIIANSRGAAGPAVDRQSIGSMGVAGVISHVAATFPGGVGGFSGDPENALSVLHPGGSGMPCIGVMCAQGAGRGGGDYTGGDIADADMWRNVGPGRRQYGPPGVKLVPRPPSGGGPIVVSRGVETKGSISREQVRRIVHRHLPEIKHCYNRGLVARPDLAGRVVVRFVVSGKGVVIMSAVSQTTLGDTKVERCIADAVRRWPFPAPSDGGTVLVNYPFQLNSR